MSHHSTVSYTDSLHQNPCVLHGISCHITLQYHTLTPDTRILTYCMESHVTSLYSIIHWHLTPESFHTAWNLMSHHITVSYTDTLHQNPYILHGISCHITLQYHTLTLDTRILSYCMESHVISPYSIIHWHLTPESLHTAWNLMSHHLTVSYTDTWHQNPYILHGISCHITLQYHTLTLDTRILTYCIESHVISPYSIIHWHLTPESLHTAWNLMSHHPTVSYTDTLHQNPYILHGISCHITLQYHTLTLDTRILTYCIESHITSLYSIIHWHLTPESLHTAWNLMSHHTTVSYTGTWHQNSYILHGISCHITLQYHTLTPYTRILTYCMESHVTSPYSIIHWHLTPESLHTAWNLMSHHSTVSYTDTLHQNPYKLHGISCHITLQYHTLTPYTRILIYCMESHVTSLYSIIHWHLTPESLHTALNLMSYHPTVSYTDTWHQNPFILHGISCHITLQYHTLTLDTRILTYCMESHVTSLYSIIHWHLTPESLHTAWNLMSHHLTVSYTDTWHQNPYILHGISCHITLQYHTLTLDTRILTYCMESHVTSPYSIIHWHLTPESLHTAWNLMSHHSTVSYTDTWHQNPYILHGISCHITLQYHTLTLDTRILTYCMESHVTSLYSIIHWHLTPESLHTAWNLISHHSTVSYTDTWHQNPYILHGISCHITLQYHTLTPNTRILTYCMDHVTSLYSIIHWHLTPESLHTAWNLMSHHLTVSYTDTWHQNPYILHGISCHITLQYHTLTLDTRILTCCMESHVTSHYSITHWHLTPESLHTAWNLMSHHSTVSYTDTWHQNPFILHGISCHITLQYHTMTPDTRILTYCMESHVTSLYSIIHWHWTPESLHTAWNLMSHHSTVSYTDTWHQNPYILHGISCHITLQYHTLTPYTRILIYCMESHVTNLQYHTLTPYTRILTNCMESHVTSLYSIIHWHLTPESLHTAWNLMSHHLTVSYTDTWHRNPYILHGISCHITLQYHTLTPYTRILTCCMESHVTSLYSIIHWHLTPESLHTAWNLMSHHPTVSYTDTLHQNPYILHGISCHITLQYHTLASDTRFLIYWMHS